jgi:FkbM family methyltransferase
VDRPGDLERPEFEQHRHDQSIFSLLAYDLERQRAIGIKRIGVERTVDENAAILGTRNGTPFRSIGVNRYKRKILSKCYSAAVKFLWNENRYRADLYESGEKLLNPGSEGVLPPAEGVRFVDRALIAYGRGFEHPCKIRLVRGLVRGLAGGRVKVRHVGGTVIAIDPEDYIGWAIFRTGSYEPVSLARALKIMSAEPGLFVDVGANFGWYTCAVASIAGTNVIGIEPDPENCAALRANIDRNGLRTVAVFHGAVGAQPALLTMSRRSPGNSGTVAVAAGRPAPGSGGYLVGSTTLQELLNALVQPQARPVLIKIDVEGFEPEVLNGLDFAGPFRPKNILIECDRALGPAAWGSYQKFAAFFTQHGYEVLDVTGRPFTGDGPFLEENAWARDRDQAR